jgi:hypothetical protein
VVCIDPKRQRKEKCTANVAAEPVQPASPSPPPPSSRQCKAPEKYEPSEAIRSRSQDDGRHMKSSGIAPSPSPPQQPRPITFLPLWLNKPKIDRRVQDLERQTLGSARSRLAELGESTAKSARVPDGSGRSVWRFATTDCGLRRPTRPSAKVRSPIITWHAAGPAGCQRMQRRAITIPCVRSESAPRRQAPSSSTSSHDQL